MPVVAVPRPLLLQRVSAGRLLYLWGVGVQQRLVQRRQGVLVVLYTLQQPLQEEQAVEPQPQQEAGLDLQVQGVILEPLDMQQQPLEG